MSGVVYILFVFSLMSRGKEGKPEWNRLLKSTLDTKKIFYQTYTPVYKIGI